MLGVAGSAAWMAVILLAAIVEGGPDPKPIEVSYFGIPASQYPAEVYRYDPRANDYGRYTQTSAPQGYPLLNHGGNYYFVSPQHGGYVTPEYAVEEPRVTGRYEHDGRGGYVNPPTVTVRPLLHTNREYHNGPVNYQQKQINGVAAPYYDPSYNGIVRKSGISDDGRDYQGEPGTYAIRGGVFPAAEYEQAEHRDGYYRAPSGDSNAYYRRYEPTYYSYDQPRAFVYSSQIHNRGDSKNPNLEREAYASGNTNNFGLRKDGYGIQQTEREVYNGNQIPRKVPVRGINSKEPQVFYPAQRGDQGHESERYN